MLLLVLHTPERPEYDSAPKVNCGAWTRCLLRFDSGTFAGLRARESSLLAGVAPPRLPVCAGVPSSPGGGKARWSRGRPGPSVYAVQMLEEREPLLIQLVRGTRDRSSLDREGPERPASAHEPTAADLVVHAKERCPLIWRSASPVEPCRGQRVADVTTFVEVSRNGRHVAADHAVSRSLGAPRGRRPPSDRAMIHS